MSEQMKALSSLAKQFSNGEKWAAKLMATIIYVICHDGRKETKIRSLLTQIGARDKLMCINTALEPTPGNLLTLPLMLGFQPGGAGPTQIPRFLMPANQARPFGRVPFSVWWEQPVYSRGTEEIITRRELVQAVRSKDGGGHFDAELSCAKYVNMKGGAGWTSTRGQEKLPPDPSHLITIWAIGWELFTSIVEHNRRLQQSPQEGV
jgi:hypothetical protein